MSQSILACGRMANRKMQEIAWQVFGNLCSQVPIGGSFQVDHATAKGAQQDAPCQSEPDAAYRIDGGRAGDARKQVTPLDMLPELRNQGSQTPEDKSDANQGQANAQETCCALQRRLHSNMVHGRGDRTSTMARRDATKSMNAFRLQ